MIQNDINFYMVGQPLKYLVLHLQLSLLLPHTILPKKETRNRALFRKKKKKVDHNNSIRMNKTTYSEWMGGRYLRGNLAVY